MVTEASQLSVATGVPTGISGPQQPEHSMVWLGGTKVKTGLVLSTTVILCVAVFVLPQPSVAVHFRISVYESGQEPLVRVSLFHTIEATIQLSVAVGLPGAGIALHWTVTLAGTEVNIGCCVSDFQVKVTKQVLALLQPSVARTVHTCVFTQVPVMLPPVALLFTVPHASVAVPAAAIAWASVIAGGLHPKLIGAVGQFVNVGGTISVFTKVRDKVAEHPNASVTVTV